MNNCPNNRQQSFHSNRNKTDWGPEPCVINVPKAAEENKCFRTSVWTGCYLQMTLMCIPTCDDIGLEMHEKTDQILRVEEGEGMVKIGACNNKPDCRQKICKGDAIFIPACAWHNIINTGDCPLKLSSIYAPPHHPRGTVHMTKESAQKK